MLPGDIRERTDGDGDGHVAENFTGGCPMAPICCAIWLARWGAVADEITPPLGSTGLAWIKRSARLTGNTRAWSAAAARCQVVVCRASVLLPQGAQWPGLLAHPNSNVFLSGTSFARVSTAAYFAITRLSGAPVLTRATLDAGLEGDQMLQLLNDCPRLRMRVVDRRDFGR
jgi:hypothetical protein